MLTLVRPRTSSSPLFFQNGCHGSKLDDFRKRKNQPCGWVVYRIHIVIISYKFYLKCLVFIFALLQAQRMSRRLCRLAPTSTLFWNSSKRNSEAPKVATGTYQTEIYLHLLFHFSLVCPYSIPLRNFFVLDVSSRNKMRLFSILIFLLFWISNIANVA